MKHFSLFANGESDRGGLFEIRVGQDKPRFDLGRQLRARFIERGGRWTGIAADRRWFSFGYILEVYESRVSFRKPQIMEFRVSSKQVGMLLHFREPGEDLVLCSKRAVIRSGQFSWHRLTVNGKTSGLGDYKHLETMFDSFEVVA